MESPDQPPAPPAGSSGKPPSLLEDATVLEQYQDEIFALVRAWQDRGMPVGEAGQLLLATANSILLMSGCSLGQVVDLAARQWKALNGRL